MVDITLYERELHFWTEDDVFSPHRIDAGTLAMLSTVTFSPDDFVLDLGCGYGVVGILAAKLIGQERVVLCDVDEKAVALSQKNAQINGVENVTVVRSDGFAQLEQTGFTLILSNPPYHTDFAVAKRFIEKGFNRLAIGGRMVMVTKRKEWYQNKLTKIFGGVKVQEVDGYYVFLAEKRKANYAGK